MPRAPHPLPARLHDSGFTVAEARAHGLTPARLRASDLAAPAWGIRHTVDAARTPDVRAQLLARRHPGSFLSHGTAAAFWRLQVEPPRDRGLVHLGVGSELPRPRGAGVRGHRLDVRPEELHHDGPIAVTSPARTWLDLASTGLNVEDLIVAADRILCVRRPLATVHELERMLLRHPGARGIRLLRSALPEAVEAADSSRETRLRVRLVNAGLPRPTPGFAVLDDRGNHGRRRGPRLSRLPGADRVRRCASPHRWATMGARSRSVQPVPGTGMAQPSHRGTPVRRVAGHRRVDRANAASAGMASGRALTRSAWHRVVTNGGFP